MFPLIPSKVSDRLNEQIAEVIKLSANLGVGLNAKVLDSLGEFMLAVNSYYTNAMEGNPSKLTDIENALAKKMSRDRVERDYQKEHLAHIETQKKMIERIEKENGLNICNIDFISRLHIEFYSRLPEEMRFATTKDGKKVSVLPGKLRDSPADVGSHLPPKSLDEVRNNMLDFERFYNPDILKYPVNFLAFASSHHRLLWIHPFRDGNGRVARLFTIAYQHKLNIASHGLWNVTRAFARNRPEYDGHLHLADLPRRNDYDGRGPLSEENLAQFCEYFLDQCIDQLNYVGSNLKFETFEKRFRSYINLLTAEKRLSKGSARIMETLLYRGEMARGEVQTILDVKRRRATDVIKELMESKLIQSDSPRGKLRLRVTTEMGSVLFPGLA